VPGALGIEWVVNMSQESVKVSIDHLRNGTRLSHSIMDADGTLLLAAGTQLTAPLKKRLVDRGIKTVMLHPQDVASMLAAPSQPAIKPTPPLAAESPPAISEINAQLANLASRVSLTVDNLGPPLKERQRRVGAEPYDPQQRDRLVKQFATTKKLMDTMIRHAIAGLSQDTRAVRAVANGATAELVQDPDQTIATSAEVPRNPQITERAVRMSVLAMAIALELNWDEQAVREVGECGLIHDWGLYRLDEEINLQRKRLTPEDRQAMQQHPLYTFEMLAKMPQLSDGIRIAAAQVHEKLDGTGYPRGLTESQIHPYAKILHVADAYVSLTEETWGRPAFISYDALVYLLNQVRNRSVSAEALRALLNVVSLFPIGSHVRLSDGSEARVIRRGNGIYTAPIVQRVGADRTIRVDSGHSSIVDLSQSELQVSAPLPHPTRQEQRIVDTATSELLWE
jgi:HD-GYP domain-containing protein (c-di-GMP phosphodiesterase class II)